jgi:hypothetical protein
MKNEELLIISEPKNNPRYGCRTLIEKVEAYRLSDGELIEGREIALEYQRKLDDKQIIDAIIKRYLMPFNACLIEGDGTIQIESTEVVSFWAVKQLLYSCKEWIKEVA